MNKFRLKEIIWSFENDSSAALYYTLDFQDIPLFRVIGHGLHENGRFYLCRSEESYFYFSEITEIPVQFFSIQETATIGEFMVLVQFSMREDLTELENLEILVGKTHEELDI